jgi:hypothetical protein
MGTAEIPYQFFSHIPTVRTFIKKIIIVEEKKKKIEEASSLYILSFEIYSIPFFLFS